MKIGELAQQAGVSARMIRYYESQGLLEADRMPNGYRHYSADHVERVRQIRGHLAAGLSTRLIRILFEMDEPRWTGQCSRDFSEELRAELSSIEERMDCLATSRDSLQELLAKVHVRT